MLIAIHRDIMNPRVRNAKVGSSILFGSTNLSISNAPVAATYPHRAVSADSSHHCKALGKLGGIVHVRSERLVTTDRLVFIEGNVRSTNAG